jgi:hypothetical protein
MKKFTVYSWRADDEGGIDVCLTNEFNPSLRYNPYSGWRARPSKKIGEFNTIDELADVLFANNPEFFETKENAIQDAKWMYSNCSVLCE